MDKISNDVRVYTDVQGLEQLRGELKSNPGAVKKEMAQQFESLFIQMVLRSMRDASNALSSGLFSTNDMNMYQDMFDKQLSLSLSSRGLGFAKIIEQNIDRQPGTVPTADIKPATITLPVATALPARTMQPAAITAPVEMNFAATHPVKKSEKTETGGFKSPHEFMNTLWKNAKHAAAVIGVHPAVLMAQAALETDWGRKIIPHPSGTSSHNLFNIKSDASWHKESASAATLEQKEGLLVKEKASFRSYASFKESFMDYANMIKSSSRYQKAVENAQEPASYTQALQEAGYASDNKYASKIMGIMKSPLFQSLMTELN
jgi:flagellar protein FlgJ